MDIKEYWETRLPQTWYSDKKPLSNEWFNEIEYKRYEVYYPYLKDIAEFDAHQGESVLEFGQGIGTDILQYARGGASVDYYDVTESAMKVTGKNLSRFGYKRSPRKHYDLVYSFGVLHHVVDTEAWISTLHDTLKPEGKMIVMLYAPGWKHWIKRMFIKGLLHGHLFKYGYQGTVNKNTEVHGDSPLTKVYFKWQVKRLFKDFGEVEITRHRLGEYFDYAPYKTWKFPGFITRIMYLLGLERWLGENWIIKAVKTEKKKKVSVWETLLKP
jgi:SAM-dependent methyltransferase